MEHPFYQKTEKQQIKIQIVILIGALLVIAASILISFLIGNYLLAFLILAIVLSVIAPFYDTPILKERGKLIYHSSMFLTEKEKKGIINIHGGTILDYVFVIDKKMNGNQRTSFIIQQYMEGLLNLISSYENKKDSSVRVKGTSYIINERTANKMGFKVVRTDFLQKMILIYNYFNLLVSNSIAKGKISFPNLNKIITVEGEMNMLIDRKHIISQLNERIKVQLSNG